MKSLRFGLVGLGYHGKGAVLPAFFHEDAHGVELTAVCDVNPANLEAVDRDVLKYGSCEEMLDKAPVDAVYVAVGMDYSFDVCMAALRKGKHVVCEKPLARSVEEAENLARAARESGLVFAVNFETRYGQRIQTLKRWIDEGRFGKINAIQFDNLWDCHKSFSPSAPRRARLLSLAGGLDCGIHEFDQARYLLGGTWSDVRALGAWFGESCTPPPHVSVIGLLNREILVTLNASLAFTANIKPRVFVDHLYLAGTEGVCVVNGDVANGHTSMQLASRTLCQTVEFDTQNHACDIALLLTEFARVVEGGLDTPHVFAGPEDGLQAQIAMAAAIGDAVGSRS